MDFKLPATDKNNAKIYKSSHVLSIDVFWKNICKIARGKYYVIVDYEYAHLSNDVLHYVYYIFDDVFAIENEIDTNQVADYLQWDHCGNEYRDNNIKIPIFQQYQDSNVYYFTEINFNIKYGIINKML